MPQADLMVGFAHQMMFARTTGEGAWEPVGRGAAVGAGSGAVAGAIIGGLIGGPVGAVAGAGLGAIAGVVVGSAVGAWIGFGNVNEAAKNQVDYFYNYHFLDAIVTGTVDKAIQRRPRFRENQDRSSSLTSLSLNGSQHSISSG